MKRLLALFLIFCFQVNFAQVRNRDSVSQPLFSPGEESFLKDAHLTMDMRFAFRHHFENGRSDDYSEFRTEQLALGISGKLYDMVDFNFRNRFNREANIQSLDNLGGSIELAYIDVDVTPKFKVQLGKMYAYFGGYEYEFNPIDVLEYNDIQDNLLNYVTGIGLTYDIGEDHTVGFQAMNSRTMRYEDLYADYDLEGISEPKWPLALVVNWRGSFFDGKFETIYSFSNFRLTKGHGTTRAITLGNKLHLNDLTIMYDFDFSYEQLDSKGLVTNIVGSDAVEKDAMYIEHWLRAEYLISPKFRSLLTLMTSHAYGKNLMSKNSGQDHLRTSYGVIPTVYFRPNEKLPVDFYLAYIHRFYNYSHYAQDELGHPNYNTGEIRFGFIAPLTVF